MRYLLLPLLLFALSPFLSGQSFNFPKAETRIYPIPAHLVDAIIKGELKTKDLPELPEPYPAATERVKLPPGHYLTATQKTPCVPATRLAHRQP